MNHWTVIVKNLPKDADEHVLRSLFETAGSVVDLNILAPTPRQVSTSAYVVFPSIQEATNAVIMFQSYKFQSRSNGTGCLNLELRSSVKENPMSDPRWTSVQPEKKSYYDVLNEVVQCEVSKRLQSSSRIVTNGYIDSPSARSRSKCKDLGTSQKVTDHPQLSPKLLKLRKQEEQLKKERDILQIELELERTTQEMLNVELKLKELRATTKSFKRHS
ncbi:uncharacterized protein LOC134181327 isoform X2 [Corticium candelabrum]|uniref:uncharacterized protein LOC134181327 isoform X2 n=1 Tax=Corticium candelabrum TaxID=121492 RepID=UPI002E277108|nr:uncharacterized protein LOC134181327 isoform X2 [Corticium candelabrum]